MPLLVFFFFYSGKEKDRPIIEGVALVATAPYYKGITDMITSSSGGGAYGMLWDRPGKTNAGKSDIDTVFTSWQGQSGWYAMSDVYLSLCWGCLLYIGATW